MKRIIVLIVALGVSAVLSGCQTSSTGFDTEKEVDISEVRIVLPEEALERDDFEIRKVIVRETGSYRSERVNFTGGSITYDRYFHGGFAKRSKSRFMKYLNNSFPSASLIEDVQVSNFAMGKVFHTTFQQVVKSKTYTCLAVSADYGDVVPLRGGPGTAGVVYGFICERGIVTNFTELMLPWLAKVRIRS